MKLTAIYVLAAVFLMYFAALACVFADLRAGVRKAKKNGVFRSSYGYRKTVKKIAEYFNMMMILTVIDAIQMALVYILGLQMSWTLPFVPVFTAIGALIVAFIELKSVREKQSDKDKARVDDAVETLLKILKNPDNREIAINVVEHLKTEKKDEKE